MKKILALVLTLTLCLSLLSVGAVAETDGEFEYTIGGRGVTILSYVGVGGDVVIPDTIEGEPVFAIGLHAFSSSNDGVGDTVTSLHIPETVTTIEHGALYGCDNATAYTVSEENPAFKSVDGVLFTKDGKTLVRYPAGKTETTYTIPESVTTIDSYAFANCKSLTSIDIPHGVTTIRDRGFYYCTGLEAVELPEGLITIEDAAFVFCKNIRSLNVPGSVTTIGECSFASCWALTSVTIGADATAAEDSGTVIGKRAFESCENLTTLTIGSGVSTIGNHAFYWCSNLTTLTFEEGVTAIEEGAFENCRNLALVTFPGSLTTIENAAFYYCNSLTTVTIPKSVTTIGRAAFAFVTDGCTPPAPMEGFVIKGVAGSEAETYALANEIFFEAIPDPDIFYGDVNGDTKIDAKDALLVLKYSVGKAELTQAQQKNAEVDGKDGINAKDALEILKYSVKKITKFPIEEIVITPTDVTPTNQ